MTWLKKGKIAVICPEVSGGLPVPRLPAQIVGAHSGEGVWKNEAKVINNQGDDVTRCFIKGAKNALSLVHKYKIKVAILKEHSPSCATHTVHDGTFTGMKKRGLGVTASLLKQAGVTVFSEKQLDEAMLMADQLDQTNL